MATFTNQATLSYNNTVTNSNVVTGELIEALSVTKNAVVSTYTNGDNITYVVSVVNSSASPFTGLTLQDDLGAYTFGTSTLVPLTYVEDSFNYYLNGVLQATPTVDTTNGITVTGITIPANGIVTFIYEAVTNEFTPLGTTDSIVNTATLSGDALASDITATATVTPEAEPNLSITKAISPSVVSENGQLTYTFVIQNTGNSATAATDNLVVTDTFNPVLNNITVTYNGTVLTEGTDYTYVNGVFTTIGNFIGVPAATYTQSADGTWVINPGVATITVTGTV